MSDVNDAIRDARRLVSAWWDKTDFCGCGCPEDVMRDVLDALRRHHEPGTDFEGGPDRDWQENNWLMMYCLDVWKLTEHGGSVGGAWLTPDGVALRDALAIVDLETVLDGDL